MTFIRKMLNTLGMALYELADRLTWGWVPDRDDAKAWLHVLKQEPDVYDAPVAMLFD